MADPLETIVQWNMKEDEAQVFKVCLMYAKIYNEMLPNMPRINFPAKGDPRKTNIFRYCWKFVRETRGILKEEQYKLFIKAQIQVLKGIKTDKDQHVHIDVQTLCGPKAWNRWKLWESKYKEIINKPNTIEEKKADPIEVEKIKIILQKDRQFLLKNIKDDYNSDDIKTFIENGKIKKWVTLGNLSYYYVALPPVVQKITEKGYFNKDLSIYNKVHESIKEFFKQVFTNEL